MSERPFVCTCGERYETREGREACEAFHHVNGCANCADLQSRLEVVSKEVEAMESLLEKATNDVSAWKSRASGAESRLDALALKWTQDLPTEPGHYWNRQKPGHRDEITIRRVFSITYRDGFVKFYADGPGLTCEDLGGEWSGPLHPPGMEPKSAEIHDLVVETSLPIGCHRAHPHENMSVECERKVMEARRAFQDATIALARDVLKSE